MPAERCQGETEMTADRLLSALDREIDAQKSALAHVGWNNWTIAAAFASLVWLAISVVEQHPPTRSAGAMVVCLVLALEVISSTIMRLRGSPSSSQTRLVAVHLRMGSLLVATAHDVARDLAFLALLYWDRPSIPQLIYVSTISYLILGVLWCGLVVLALRVGLPVSASVSKKYVLGPIVMLGFGFFIVAGLGVALALQARANDVRLALLVAAALWLLRMLSRRPGPPPVLANLAAIRTELAFGRISVAAALEQAEIAVLGLRVSHDLQRYLSDSLAALEAAAVPLRDARDKIMAITPMFEGGPSEVDAHMGLISEMLDGYNRDLDAAMKAASAMLEIVKPFARRASLIILFAPATKAEVDELFGRLDRARINLSKENEELRSRHNEFMKAAARMKPSQEGSRTPPTNTP